MRNCELQYQKKAISFPFLSHCVSYGFSEVSKLDLKKKSASKKVEEEKEDEEDDDEEDDEVEETHKKTPATARYTFSKDRHKT